METQRGTSSTTMHLDQITVDDEDMQIARIATLRLAISGQAHSIEIYIDGMLKACWDVQQLEQHPSYELIRSFSSSPPGAVSSKYVYLTLPLSSDSNDAAESLVGDLQPVGLHFEKNLDFNTAIQWLENAGFFHKERRPPRPAHVDGSQAVGDQRATPRPGFSVVAQQQSRPRSRGVARLLSSQHHMQPPLLRPQSRVQAVESRMTATNPEYQAQVRVASSSSAPPEPNAHVSDPLQSRTQSRPHSRTHSRTQSRTPSRPQSIAAIRVPSSQHYMEPIARPQSYAQLPYVGHAGVPLRLGSYTNMRVWQAVGGPTTVIPSLSRHASVVKSARQLNLSIHRDNAVTRCAEAIPAAGNQRVMSLVPREASARESALTTGHSASDRRSPSECDTPPPSLFASPPSQQLPSQCRDQEAESSSPPPIAGASSRRLVPDKRKPPANQQLLEENISQYMEASSPPIEVASNRQSIPDTEDLSIEGGQVSPRLDQQPPVPSQAQDAIAGTKRPGSALSSVKPRKRSNTRVRHPAQAPVQSLVQAPVQSAVQASVQPPVPTAIKAVMQPSERPAIQSSVQAPVQTSLECARRPQVDPLAEPNLQRLLATPLMSRTVRQVASFLELEDDLLHKAGYVEMEVLIARLVRGFREIMKDD